MSLALSLATRGGRDRLIIAVCLVLAVGFLASDLNRYVRRMPAMTGSLNRWLPLTERLDHGPRLYAERSDYLYPPVFLVLIQPLAQLDKVPRAVAFELTKLVCLVLAICLGWRILGDAFGKVHYGVLIAAVLLTGRYLENDLSHGNINVFLLFLVMAGCRLWQKDYQGSGGLLLSLAVSIKVTPLLLLGYGAYKRQWRLVLGGVAGLFLWLALVPSLQLGWRANGAMLAGWYDHVIVPFSARMDIYALHTNQSLAGTLLRYLSPVAAIEKPTTTYINVMDLTRGQVLVVYKAIAAGLLIFAWFGLRGAIQDKMTPRFAMHLSILLVLMVLLSGYSWLAHFVYLFLPYLVLVAAWTSPHWPGRRRWLAACIGASFMLGTATTSLFPTQLTDLFYSYGVVTAGAILILVTLVVVSARWGRSAGERAQEAGGCRS